MNHFEDWSYFWWSLIRQWFEPHIIIPEFSFFFVKTEGNHFHCRSLAVDCWKQLRHFVGQFDAVWAPSRSEVESDVTKRKVFELGRFLRLDILDLSKTVEPVKYAHMNTLWVYILLKFLWYDRLSPVLYPLHNKESIFIEGYQHIDYKIIICLHCYLIIKSLGQHRSFIYFSFLLNSM